MAEIEANFRSRAITARAGRSRLRRAVTRRIVVRTGAGALALLGVAALVVHPAIQDLAEQYAIWIATGVAALVIVGIQFLFSEPEIRRDPGPEGESEDMALAESERAALESCGRLRSRYLEFYRALAPSPSHELDPLPSPVDLVHEEALEERGKSERQADGEHDGSRT
jgi:hypothetical protein